MNWNEKDGTSKYSRLYSISCSSVQYPHISQYCTSVQSDLYCIRYDACWNGILPGNNVMLLPPSFVFSGFHVRA